MLKSEYPFEGVRAFDSLFPPTQPQDGKLEIGLQSFDKAVDSRLVLTRALFRLVRSGRGALVLPGIDEPREVGVTLSDSGEEKLLYGAKLYRKLKYIERVFNVEFSLPNEISSKEVQSVEKVFRGITEGAFSMRYAKATFRISPKDISLSEPPYSSPGHFDAIISEEIALFDQSLRVGPVTVSLDTAQLANPRVMDEVRKGSNEPVLVRFEILDNQMWFRFEDFVEQTREALGERLERFKQELALEDPEELVDLVSEPLAKDVSSSEADQIAVGWTFYNRLSDRFCPQDPEIDRSTGHWRVPIWLVYANGEGGPVGDLLIHKESGVILSHTPMEELHSKAMALADTILHA